jgi:3-hydroxyacyl-CoA dehydrogenase / enoyl-CoA hydratase / 3-hydroxybutyryl-CoA epimerase / enoyl-CoA isomerase
VSPVRPRRRAAYNWEPAIGLHVFNPVPVMSLVEAVRQSHTSAEALAGAVSHTGSPGKRPFVVRDCPGFLSNRVLTGYLFGCFRALCDGADFRVIDLVMESFGWPMGPTYLEDVIGLDTVLRVVAIISGGYPPLMAYEFSIAPQIFLGQQPLGQKRGAGYYQYGIEPKGKPKKLPDAEAYVLHASLQRARGAGARGAGDHRPAHAAYEHRVVAVSRGRRRRIFLEIDLAMVLGLGFLRYAGGSQVGRLAEVAECCRAVQRLCPLKDDSIQCAAQLPEMPVPGRWRYSVICLSRRVLAQARPPRRYI